MSRSFSVFLSWHSSFCHLKHTVRNAGAVISVTNWHSNMTWLASCFLRWHGLTLLKSVYFAVSPQVLHDFCFPAYFCVLHVCMWIWTSEVSFRCLPQLCPPYFWDRISLNWSSLYWLDWIASELQGCTFLHFWALRGEAGASASGFYVGPGVQTRVHALCISSKHYMERVISSLELRVFLQKKE